MRHLVVALLLSLICGVNTHYSGVQSFGLLKLGAKAFFKPGNNTSHPYMVVPASHFYVYVVAEKTPTMCVYIECGANGNLVEQLGGWVDGDSNWIGAEQLDVDETDVRHGKFSAILFADRQSRIVGIYPYRTMYDLIDLLAEHPRLLGRS